MASTNFRLVAVADILVLRINDPFHTNQTSQTHETRNQPIGLTKHVHLVLPLTSGAKMASTNFRLVAVADILMLRINDAFHTNPSSKTWNQGAIDAPHDPIAATKTMAIDQNASYPVE